jgi:xylan 1,4-beta-xylosidase
MGGSLPDFLLGAAASGFGQSTIDVQVDLTRDQGVFMPVYRWFGYDESNYTTTQKWPGAAA